MLESRDCLIVFNAYVGPAQCAGWAHCVLHLIRLCTDTATTECQFDVHAACFIQWSEFQRNQVRASYSSRRLKRELIRDFPGSEITEENIDAFLKEAVANGDFGLPYIG